MVRTLSTACLCGLILLRQAHAQEVFIAREQAPKYPKAQAVSVQHTSAEAHAQKAVAVTPEKIKPAEKIKAIEKPAAPPVVAQKNKPDAGVPEHAKKTASMAVTEPATKSAPVAKTTAVAPGPKAVSVPAKPAVAVPPPSRKPETQVASVAKVALPPVKPAVVAEPAKKPVTEVRTGTSVAAASPLQQQTETSAVSSAQPVNNRLDTAFTKLADGFDFPVGKPDAQGYYKARGFRSKGHVGEDWDGVGGGDTDLGDPIYSIGDGIVVFARDCHMGWGNVIIVRHTYREGGAVKNVDALYAHLNNLLVRRGQTVARGQKIAGMGTAHGLYDAHLHLEIRKNLEIGMSRAAFAQDFSNYYDPSLFIQAHRHLQTGGGTYRVALNTFTRDAHIKWDKARNYSHAHTGGGSSESAVALKKAIAAQH
jgi:murein DD-endopeptidase MepM/ murein hydrolase activator NlpD